MRPSKLLSFLLVAALSHTCLLPAAHAEITMLGDVEPNDPADWITADTSYVGNTASGTLTIDSGSTLTSSLFAACYLGYQQGMSGLVVVDGFGSTWAAHDCLVGKYGSGTLSITGGATVTTRLVQTAGIQSLVAIDVGKGSSLTCQKTFLQYVGTTRVFAGASVAASDVYRPIIVSSNMWRDSGTQALGGTWDAVNHQFTVSAVQTGTAGNAVNLDLTTTQRAFVSDAATNWAIGTSFLAATASKPLTLTATTIGSGDVTAIGSLLGAKQKVLSGWSLVTTGGFNVGDPAYLSLGVGAGQLRDDLQVWQYADGSWSKFSAFDLTYDNHYASLTVLAMGVYAVSGDIVIQGDANHDGTVNSNDLGLMLTHYNETVVGDNGWAIGDFNGDGTVNSNDLGLFLTHYNQSIPSTTAVPEPATLAMLVMAFAAVACWRRKS